MPDAKPTLNLQELLDINTAQQLVIIRMAHLLCDWIERGTDDIDDFATAGEA